MSAWWEPYVDGERWRAAMAAMPPLTPDQVRAKVGEALAELGRVRAALERAVPLLRTPADHASWDGLWRQYAALVAPILADSTPEKPKTQVGSPLAFAAIVVAGLALGAWAVAWAVVHLADVARARQFCELWLEDLHVRERLAEKGLTLQPSTLPQSYPAEGSTGNGGGSGGFGALAGLLLLGLVAGGVAVAATKGD